MTEIIYGCPQCKKPTLIYTEKGFHCEECSFRVVIFDPKKHVEKKRKEMLQWEQIPEEKREYKDKPCVTCEFMEVCMFQIDELGKKRICMS